MALLRTGKVLDTTAASTVHPVTENPAESTVTTSVRLFDWWTAPQHITYRTVLCTCRPVRCCC